MNEEFIINMNKEEIDIYMKNKRIDRILNIFIFTFLFLILSSLIIIVYNSEVSISQLNKKIFDVDSSVECSNLSFQDTAICLNDFVREIFIYNLTDDDLDLTLEELKERGGDCKNYVDFYLEYMEYYGYNKDNQIVRGLVKKNETLTTYHVSLMSFDSTGYCHFDMRDLECYKYKSDSGEVEL